MTQNINQCNVTNNSHFQDKTLSRTILSGTRLPTVLGSTLSYMINIVVIIILKEWFSYFEVKLFPARLIEANC